MKSAINVTDGKKSTSVRVSNDISCLFKTTKPLLLACLDIPDGHHIVLADCHVFLSNRVRGQAPEFSFKVRSHQNLGFRSTEFDDFTATGSNKDHSVSGILADAAHLGHHAFDFGNLYIYLLCLL